MRDFLGPALILVGPPAVSLLMLAFKITTWSSVVELLSRNWGNVASVWGLAVGLYVLIVASGARRAAEEARLRSRRQSLTEELEEAKNKVQQMGHFLAVDNLAVVRIRGEEILASCQSVLQRWDNDPLWRKSKNKLLSATEIIRTIAEIAATKGTLDADEKKQTAIAQLKASELLSAVLAGSRGLQEQERD